MLVEYTKAGVYHIGGIMFKPGVNDVDDKLWEGNGKDKPPVKDHPHVKEKIESGELKVLSKKGGAPLTSLKDLAPSEAVKLVGSALDHELLVKWYQSESRAAVKGAIEGQLKKLDLNTSGKPLESEKEEK